MLAPIQQFSVTGGRSSPTASGRSKIICSPLHSSLTAQRATAHYSSPEAAERVDRRAAEGQTGKQSTRPSAPSIRMRILTKSAEIAAPSFRRSKFKGEVSRLILDAFRKSGAPVPVSDLTLTVAAGHGISADDKPLMRVLLKRAGACPRNLWKKNLVLMTRSPGASASRRLAEQKHCEPVGEFST